MWGANTTRWECRVSVPSILAIAGLVTVPRFSTWTRQLNVEPLLAQHSDERGEEESDQGGLDVEDGELFH